MSTTTTKSKVIVYNSNLDNANNGLFAKTIFHKGDIVCEYAGNIKNKTYMAELYISNYKEYLHLHKYVRDLDNDRVIIGDHKLIDNDWMKSGVYVNDGACLDVSVNYNPVKDGKLIATYIDNSKMKQNVEAITQDDKIYYVATKRIKKGEEIYAHYGKHYWLLLSGIHAGQLCKF
jgi:SET domain-containing protein